MATIAVHDDHIQITFATLEKVGRGGAVASSCACVPASLRSVSMPMTSASTGTSSAALVPKL